MKTIINLVDDGQLWNFHGGIYPPSRKERTEHQAIASVTLPDALYLPLAQHIGHPAIPIVTVGEYVTKGQILAKQDGFISAAIIAPTSGTIKAIALHSNNHPSGIATPTITLVPDHLDTWRERQPLTITAEKELLLERIRLSGVTGLGGASFPTAVKLATTAAIDFLIINGAECEPYITSDDALMQERSDTIVAGIEIMSALVNPQRIIVAIEDNKPKAIAAMNKAAQKIAQRLNIIVRAIPTLYPAGGEKQLIEVLTSKQVPTGKIPVDIGILVQNVATSYAVAQAVLEDKPLLSRIVTVSGDLVKKPGNYEVPFGLGIDKLLEHVQFTPQASQKIIIGGPMMGFALHHIDAPVLKATNCIIAASNAELPEPPAEQNCIRCGDCEQVCPADLLPQQLQWFAKDQDHQKLKDHNLFDCIECGACAFVCPSAIPLVQYYRVAKSEIRHANEEKRQAERAKERFELRNLRLERDKAERLEKSKKAAEARKATMSANNDGDAVAAALARIKAKKSAAAQSDTPAPAVNPQDRVAAAIARAKAKKAQQQLESESSETTADADPQKARVAAAIARAKAKKAQQQTSDGDQAPAESTTEADPQKARVAAAIARAKAKRAQQASAEQAPDSDEAQVSAEPTADVDPQKARVAAAIARAKAKRAQQAAEQTPDSDEVQASAEPTADVDPQKARVAAAIARAKAKRAQQAAEQTPDSDEVQAPAEPTADVDPQKARVAAAIARAKAKRAQQQADLNHKNDQT